VIFNRSISDWRFYLFIALLVGAPFSKYPSISLPLFNFPSFRIGLYQIIAVLFILLCLKPIYTAGIKYFSRHHRYALYALITIGILSSASIAWSLYPARSALLAGSVVLLVCIVISGWWFAANELTAKRSKQMLTALLYASVTFGIIAVLQLVIFTLTDQTLGILCPGCTAEVFGFPRVNGFAAEPQFFANAMIPFVFAALYSVTKQPSRLGWAALVASVSTIGLTFSRGAYVALAASLLISAIALVVRKFTSIKNVLIIFTVIIATIFTSLLLLIGSASIRYSSTPNITYETTDSIAEHLTNGIVDLPEKQTMQPETKPVDDETFVSPGLIEASGNERLNAAELAIRAWQYSLATLLFGVGIGNLGPFVVANIEPTAPDNLTVYIYYILLLSELGILGLLALLTLFGTAITSLYKENTLHSIMIMGILTAFAVQFLFFGSYINVVYIWLWIGIALGVTSVAKKKPKSIKKV
jgi:hypothetical protein